MHACTDMFCKKSVGNTERKCVHQHFNLSLEYFMFLYYLNFQDHKCILHMWEKAILSLYAFAIQDSVVNTDAQLILA